MLSIFKERLYKLANTLREKGNKGYADFVLKFIDNPNVTNSQGYTLPMFAAKNGNIQLLKILASVGININQVKRFKEIDENSKTKLVKKNLISIAIENGHQNIVEEINNLIKRQRSLNVRLHSAVNNGSYEEAYEAIIKGAYIEAKTLAGETPLITASTNGNFEICKLLIESGANVNAEDTLGSTSIMWASYSDDIDILNLLIDSGANVNQKDKEKNCTPLMWWATNSVDNVEAIKILINAGANILDVDKFLEEVGDGYLSAKDYALKKGNIEIADYLDILEHEIRKNRKKTIYDINKP